MMPTPSSKPAAAMSSEALAGAGFTPMAHGSYARGEFRLTIGAHWCVLEAPDRSAPVPGRRVGPISKTVEFSIAVVERHVSAPEDGRTPPTTLGAPGLWKRVGAAGAAGLIFALPRRIWDDAASTDTSFDGEITVLEQCLQWALDAAQDSVPPEWQAPSRALVESWFKPEQLTVVAGSLLRQGEVICESDQLAIRFPLVPELPPDLPESRHAWLRSMITEAQERWHLVRVDVLTGSDGQSSAVAEVDLTGVPHEIAEDLFVISLEALRWVVQWLGETTDWLADATVASELLAVCPDQQP